MKFSHSIQDLDSAYIYRDGNYMEEYNCVALRLISQLWGNPGNVHVEIYWDAE